MIANRVPGGLHGKTTEFYSVMQNNEVFSEVLFNGMRYSFNDAPNCRKDILRNRLEEKPEAKKAYISMVGNDESKVLEQMSICMFGLLNDDPDIDENGKLSEPEFVPCHKRGNCDYEGIGCSSLTVNGIFLSKSETAVFLLCYMPDKLIADQLFLSVQTVKKHFQNIRKKTGFNDKLEMVHFASTKKLI